MYERTLEDGNVISFGHEGLLYEKSFVMYDRESDSLWLHVTGKAIKGPRKGTTLKFFPSTLTTWAQWKRRFPETEVLSGERADGFMGTFGGMDRRNLGLAIVEFGEAKLYPFFDLESSAVLNDKVGKTEIVVVYSKDEGVARAFERVIDGETLSFITAGTNAKKGIELQDIETESYWSGLSGQSLDGVYEGESLRPLVCYPILIDRYRVFFPEGVIHGEDAEGDKSKDDRGKRKESDERGGGFR